VIDRLVIHWPRLGPYHLARLRGAHEYFTARGVSVAALEVAGMDRTYGWKKESGPTSFDRITVFPDRYYDDLTANELKAGIFAALDSADPTAVAINGYAFKDSRVCLDWCISKKRKAILMTETTSADSSRAFLREVAKRVLLRRFDAAICGGKLHREYLLSLGMPAHRIFNKYDVVDNDYFSNRRSADADDEGLPGLDDRRPFFLASNRFIPRKNVDGLLTAYQRYRSQFPAGWRLVLLGDGDLGKRLRQRMEDERIQDVVFAGFRQAEDLRLYYSRASCFIHPAFNEPWGLVVNEAMAAGLPVIVSKGAGCGPDLVEPGENGFLFDPRESEELVDAMVRISRDSGLQERMSRRSREIISEWTIYDFAQNLWNAFCTPDAVYRLVRFNGRKFLAYRDDNRKLAGIDRIETFTVRRQLALMAVRAAIVTHLDQFWFHKTTLDDPALVSSQVSSALREVRERLSQPAVDYLFAWPTQIKRRRTYAYAFDRAGEACAFIKLSEAGEGQSLGNGFTTLQSLTGISHPWIKFPRPLTFGEFGNTCFHVTECVPLTSANAGTRRDVVSAEECVESYGGPIASVAPDALMRLAWMEAFWQTIHQDSPFARAIKEDQRLGARCRRVHGDLTIANLIFSGGDVWIIDWELSDSMGPCLTDLVTFFLGQRQRDLVKRPQRTLQQFQAYFIDNHSQSEKRDARFALAFLYGANSGLGRRLVNAWNEGAE
jgi:glycosyltransferase involved in cell wall biosynthesis